MIEVFLEVHLKIDQSQEIQNHQTEMMVLEITLKRKKKIWFFNNIFILFFNFSVQYKHCLIQDNWKEDIIGSSP
jgi:hypothetical protein